MDLETLRKQARGGTLTKRFKPAEPPASILIFTKFEMMGGRVLLRWDEELSLNRPGWLLGAVKNMLRTANNGWDPEETKIDAEMVGTRVADSIQITLSYRGESARFQIMKHDEPELGRYRAVIPRHGAF